MKLSTLIGSALFSTLLLLSGCAGGGPQPGEPVVTDKTLPQVRLNGHLSDTNAIAFEWKPVRDPRVRGVRIYRNTPESNDTKLYRIASIDDTLKTHYVDNGLKPGTAYRYRFTTFDADGRESLPDRTVTARTLKTPGPVSFFTATSPLARSAKLLWRPHPDLRVTGYEIERRDPGDDAFRELDRLDGRLQAEYIDRDLDDNAFYRYRIVAVTCSGDRTPPSKEVTVSTKPLPQPPKQLHASRDGIRSIDLRWSPSPTKDVVSYNVYRAYRSDSAYGLVGTSRTTHYTDRTGKDGARFFYRVSAVDKDGLESRKSAPAEGTTLAPPRPPKLLGVTPRENAVVIRWEPTDPRTVKYTLVKTTKTGWVSSTRAQYTDLKTTVFTDPNVVPGREYTYRVIAVDANGLESEPSESASVVPEAP